MVALNNYELTIPEGNESNGYVDLYHGQNYTIKMKNLNASRCKVKVIIDGKEQGSWIASSFSSNNVLERPEHRTDRFTFYEVGTVEGNLVGLNPNNDKLGLVTVEFAPEVLALKPMPTAFPPAWSSDTKNVYSYGGPTRSGGGERSAGGTGYSGHSNQQFGQAQTGTWDEDNKTTLHLRLRSKGQAPKPLTSVNSSPVPPPVR